jgi:3-hydroxybutyryl-CoA dehydrogenase
MNVEHVGIVGAGVMGVGVAHSLAQTGHRVTLVDLTREILDRAVVELRRSLRFHRLFHGGSEPEAAESVLERVELTTDYGRLAELPFVVENATECWETKREIYPLLERTCKGEAIFAVNTSAIPITRIAGLTRRPDRVLGMHFMNPVPLKPTVEVIRGVHTSEQTLATARSLLAAMGKSAVVVNDSPGFVSNRVLMLTINEAIFLLHEDVASAEEIDRIFKTCFGHKMGPLETADLIGLDTILLSIDVLYESLRDSKYRACPLLQRMVDAGLHGRKTGRGFYNYRGPRDARGPMGGER